MNYVEPANCTGEVEAIRKKNFWWNANLAKRSRTFMNVVRYVSNYKEYYVLFSSFLLITLFSSTFSDFIQMSGFCPVFCLPLDLFGEGGVVASLERPLIVHINPKINQRFSFCCHESYSHGGTLVPSLARCELLTILGYSRFYDTREMKSS